MAELLPLLRPIPIKERLTVLFVAERARADLLEVFLARAGTN